MTTIIAEINTIGELLSDVGATSFYKQDIPKKHVANTIGIRWLGDVEREFTNVAYTVLRTYQVIYFGKSEIDCIGKVDNIRSELSRTPKTKVRDEDAYITLGGIGFSQPIKSETDGVYFVIGIMQSKIFAKRPKSAEDEYELIQFVGTGLNDYRLEITSEDVKFTKNGGTN